MVNFKINLSIFFLLYLSAGCLLANDKSKDRDNEIIMAKVDSKQITLDDFIRRAEYTIRPVWCKGDLYHHKKIILNSLIAEKILSIEAGDENEAIRSEMFSNMIAGLKEQKMRELLSYYEGVAKVKHDTNELKQIYSVAGRTYNLEYFNIPNSEEANNLAKKYSGKDSSFKEIYKSSFISDSVYEREVSWSSPESKIIHKALFSQKLRKNQVIGPLNINDTTNLFINIKGWNDRVVFTEKDISERWNDVKEKVTREKADSIYEAFVLQVMADKKITFNVDVFNEVVMLLAPYYLNMKKKSEDDFLKLAYNNNLEVPELKQSSSDYNEIKNEILFTITGEAGSEDWTVAGFKKLFDKHPLVFRKDDGGNKFAARLRFAIVDLVRDKYLTDVAYQRGYDKDQIVVNYEQSWLDAGVAFYRKQEYLKNFDLAGKNEIEIVEGYLNPYIEKLLKKYSDKIEINVEEFEKIKLTRTDMFVIQEQVPYPVYVPGFPQLTSYNKLDYGKKMTVENSRN